MVSPLTTALWTTTQEVVTGSSMSGSTPGGAGGGSYMPSWGAMVSAVTAAPHTVAPQPHTYADTLEWVCALIIQLLHLS